MAVVRAIHGISVRHDSESLVSQRSNRTEVDSKTTPFVGTEAPHNRILLDPFSRAFVLSVASHRVSAAPVMGRPGFSASAKVKSTINERKMGECLRKIPQLPVFFGIIFFRQKADIVAQRQQVLEK